MRPRGRKACGLLAFLAVAPRYSLSRERAADLLWSDRGTEQARTSLRQTIAELRSIDELGEVLTIGRDAIGLGPDMPATDIDELVSNAAQRNATALARGLADAVGLFAADLMGLSPSFDEWLAAERVRQQDRLFGVVIDAVGAMIGDRHPPELGAILQALDRLDPWNEAVARLAMRADHAAGDFASLHRRYRALARGLADTYQAEPGEETRTLYHQLGALQAGADAATVAGAASPGLARTTPPTIFVSEITALGASEQSREIAAIISDDLRTALARHRELRVLSLETIDPVDLRDSCRDALSAYTLSGRLRQVGGDLRVNIQIGNVQSGTIAWSDQITIRADDLAADIDALVARSVGAVPATVERDLALLQALPSEGRDDSVIRFAAARRAIRQARTLEATRAGAAMLERLVEQDEGHVGARMLLARLYNTDYWQRSAGHDHAALRARALELIDEAAALDPTDLAIHVRLAWCHLRQGRWLRAEHGLRQSAAALPYDADSLNICAFGLCHLGGIDEAQTLMQRAFLVNPFPPADFHADFAVMKMLEGDAQGAEEHFEISGELGLQYVALRLANLDKIAAVEPQRTALSATFATAFVAAWQQDRPATIGDVLDWTDYTFPLRREEDKALVRGGLSTALAGVLPA